MLRETVAELSLSALDHNMRQVIGRVGERKIIAVVKANAYGHGAVTVARHLSRISLQGGSPHRGSRPKGVSPVAMLGVASLDEGIVLRKEGITLPILLLTGCPVEGIGDLVRYNLTPALYDAKTLPRLSHYAKKRGCKIAVHVKVDTGMGRLGVSMEEAVSFIQKVSGEGIAVEGLFSHFADADLADLSYARLQLTRLKKIAKTLKKTQPSLPSCHLANSAAIINFAPAHLDFVRPGLMLYGYSSLQKKSPVRLLPVLTVKSRVISLKEVPAGTTISYGRTFVTKRVTKVAGVAIGYADGYPRSLSNVGVMIAKGKRVPVIGRVCMDMTLLDVTAASDLAVGDWVTVIGQEGNQAIWADELAQKANTIVYEILCGMNERIPKVYLS